MDDIESVVQTIVRSGGSDLGDLVRAYRADGLPPPVVHLNPMSDDLRLEPHRSLLTWWQECRGTAPLPSAALITPDSLRRFLGRLIVLEPVGVRDFRYRLYGSTIAQFVGMDLTGKRLSETVGLRRWPELTIRYYLVTYRAAVVAQRPLYTTQQLSGATTLYVWHRLLLPFADDDGAVSRVLLYTVPCDLDGTPLPAWAGSDR